MTENGIIPQIGNKENDVPIHPVIIGDSAFPSQTWLLKGFTNHNLDEKQNYFNYHLSRARMVVEGAYG